MVPRIAVEQLDVGDLPQMVGQVPVVQHATFGEGVGFAPWRNGGLAEVSLRKRLDDLKQALGVLAQGGLAGIQRSERRRLRLPAVAARKPAGATGSV